MTATNRTDARIRREVARCGDSGPSVDTDTGGGAKGSQIDSEGDV